MLLIKELNMNSGGTALKFNKKLIFEMKSEDRNIEQIIQLHYLLWKSGHLSAVHSRLPCEVFESIGGFKNLYPVIYKICKSNLNDLGRDKSARLLSLVFKVLETLMHGYPDHIN